jgi:hypothetical protein
MSISLQSSSVKSNLMKFVKRISACTVRFDSTNWSAYSSCEMAQCVSKRERMQARADILSGSTPSVYTTLWYQWDSLRLHILALLLVQRSPV